MVENSKVWDVIVIGGGPAGMMAAGTAGKRGKSVILLEKNLELGKKLLITGGGRCNLTNSQFDNKKLLLKFKENEKFLYSTFSKWSVKETLDFFHSYNMATKVENELRTFPVSDSAKSVFEVMNKYILENKVEVLLNSPVSEILIKDDKIIGVILKNKKIILGNNVIIATGGTSRPETGSTGDGFNWLIKLGHNVSLPIASLVPISIKDDWVKKMSGTTLENISITIYQNNKVQEKTKGKILFTHFGISGPTVLNLSKNIGELLKYGPVEIKLDLMPETGHDKLNQLFQKVLIENQNSNLKNSLKNIFPSVIVDVILNLCDIDGEKKSHSVTKPERLLLIKQSKEIPMKVDKLLGEDKAIISSGGVNLEEIDCKTMRSKKYSNLFLIGDILNIDRPSGGYSLQLCWTTGFVAGDSV